ncbi:Tn7-like element transposition protein TnsE [Acinetobacter johnsonii]|uniref:Tn7-like element transposition protein TnsE n=1 Tax=Acinetobacter johnsonii TaxID=40214 RepID=UPI001D17D72B|nr:Tn7-like element transposition protein TnsE [Acinetobacter johnsonii]WQE03004.1 Tn7-like element transposition protein TnsE [Acinetobacter johnsonii]
MYKRFRGHKFANNQLRYFYVYKIFNIENNHQFYLCEIDTSDGKKNISTLLLPYEKVMCAEKTGGFNLVN